jgi:magnesium transporter
VIRASYYKDANTGAIDVAPDDLASHRGSGPEDMGLLWVDVENPTSAEVASLSEQLGIHYLTAEDLQNPQQRTKLERYGDHYHVALRDCVLTGDKLIAREVDVVFGDGWLLSARHSDEGAGPAPIDEARIRFERQRGDVGANDEGFLLWALLDVIVDRYFTVTERVDERLDVIEDIVFDDTPAGTPREIFALRRAMVAFRRAVAPLREALGEVLRKEVECIQEPALVHMQDVFDHTLRVLDLIESQRELLTGLLEGQLAVQSNQMSRVMKATSSWGAILIAATLIAGVYGMNFDDMPELRWAFGYPFALGLMLAVTGILYAVFKRRGWL